MSRGVGRTLVLVGLALLAHAGYSTMQRECHASHTHTTQATHTLLVHEDTVCFKHTFFRVIPCNFRSCRSNHPHNCLAYIYFLSSKYALDLLSHNTDRSFLKLAEEEYTGLPRDVSLY